MIAGWLAAVQSGAVAGLPGFGKSNLLGFLCHHERALARHIPEQFARTIPLLIDFNSLPSSDLSTLYRTILRTFFEFRHRFPPETSRLIERLFDEIRATNDSFLALSALREVLADGGREGLRIALVMDRFDKLAAEATPEWADTLRSLRDNNKESLCFIVGMRHEPRSQPNANSFGELFELIDLRVCWVWPMNRVDAAWLIAREVPAWSNVAGDNKTMLDRVMDLTGGIPALLKVVGQSYTALTSLPDSEWDRWLLDQPAADRRLQEIWGGLSQAEQATLAEVGRVSAAAPKPQHEAALRALVEKGVVFKDGASYRVVSELLRRYPERRSRQGRGLIWRNWQTDELFQGETPLQLDGKSACLLSYFIANAHVRLTKSEIIAACWPPQRRDQVDDSALSQQIRTLRKVIEPDPSQPSYLRTWYGSRDHYEGGYQFNPEG